MSDQTEHHEAAQHTRRAESAKAGGALAWMAKNPVAANIIMFLLLVGGLASMPYIKQEVFPEFDLDIVTVVVPYPGASPEEVEQGVLLSIEEAVTGVDGVKDVTATASEGAGVVTIELQEGTDAQQALSDIKNNVDRISSFPVDAERPVVSVVARRSQVVTLVISGDVEETVLRELAESLRDGLIQEPDISYVELASIRPLEISVEVPQETLRNHGLTLEQVAQTIGASSLELPGGSVKTEKGEVLIRTNERRSTGQEFGDIIVVSRRTGEELRLGEIATIKDGFQELDQDAFFNGQRAVEVNVYRVGDETPIEVAAAVDDYVERARVNLPPGVEIAKLNDRSDVYRQRIDLLMNNAYMGLALVFIILGLFLQIRLAFWVMMGIPISFLGSFLLMPLADASINMISLFAFILTLGIVVDDAIVVGEAVFKCREDGMSPLDAAIAGVREVSGPVVFSVLTTCIAFVPLFFIPGTTGKFFFVIPVVVISIIAISLFESMFILPAHLAHLKDSRPGTLLGWVDKQQGRFTRMLDWFIDTVYGWLLRRGLRQKWLVVAFSVAILMSSFGLVAGGRLKSTFFPKIDSDTVTVNVEMQFGTPMAVTQAYQEHMLKAAQETLEEMGGAEAVSKGVYATVGRITSRGFGGGGTTTGGHVAQITVYLVSSEDRDFTSSVFAQQWRAKLKEVPGLESLTFDYSTGPAAGAAIDLELSHPSLDTLKEASQRLAGALGGYEGVKDIDDGFREGKEQMDFRLLPEGRRVGLTVAGMARQLRASFYGVEAVRQQRGRNELRVFVRLPREQRVHESDVEGLILRTPAGQEVPLYEVAEVERGASYTSITRKNGRRAIRVTADVDANANANQVVEALQQKVIPQLRADFPGLTCAGAGQQQQQADTFGALKTGFLLVLLAMFGLMAIEFKSYVQPLIIMVSIPFGVVGSFWGHALMGYDLSLMSFMGIVALSGVVVNDSIVLISAINDYRADGMTVEEAVYQAGCRRFRPILLTSATTFFGLAPMIAERSVQARFLIPMALSLGFGIVFSTFVVLFQIPALYLIIEQLKNGLAAGWRFVRSLYVASPPEGEEHV